jgi:hypothetical protein
MTFALEMNRTFEKVNGGDERFVVCCGHFERTLQQIRGGICGKLRMQRQKDCLTHQLSGLWYLSRLSTPKLVPSTDPLAEIQ